MRKSAVGHGASWLVALVMVVLVAGLALADGARAQNYPPPVGSLSVEAAGAAVGSTTNVSATVLDNAGDPVEGAEVIFTITSQPGSDAAWANGGLETTAVTNASGVATVVLSVGSTAGNIIIETVSGEKTSQVTVAAAASDAGELPTTGGTPLEGSEEGLPAWQIAIIAIGAAMLLAGGLTIAIRHRGRA